MPENEENEGKREEVSQDLQIPEDESYTIVEALKNTAEANVQSERNTELSMQDLYMTPQFVAYSDVSTPGIEVMLSSKLFVQTGLYACSLLT